MDDQPNTQAEPVRAVAVVVPTRWLDMGEDYAELLVQREAIAVTDFYREDKTQ